jgi:hypothetical protein
MNRCFVVIGLAALAIASSAHGAPRTFAASNGSDVNACSIGAPCRTLQAAVNAVDNGGEVVTLDTAGYGSVSIAKSVTIRAPRGVVASITNNVGDAVVVNGGGVRVRLIGLSIASNQTASGAGIRLQQGAELSVQDCSTEGFAVGILNESSGGRLVVADTTIRAANVGLKAEVGSGSTFAALDRVRVEHHLSHGVYAGGLSRVVARDTVVVGRGPTFAASYSGFVALGTAAGGAELIIENSTATNTGCGICSGPIGTGGLGKVTVSNSLSYNDDRGAQAAGGSQILTFGNNRISDNASCNGTCFNVVLSLH